MSAPVFTVDERARLVEVDRRLSEDQVSGLLVVDEQGVPVGMISRTDLIRVGGSRVGGSQRTLRFSEAALARSAMSGNPVTIGADEPISEAARLMRRRRLHRLLVVAGTEPVGVFSTSDAMRAIRDQRVRDPLGQFASKAIASAVPAIGVAAASQRLLEGSLRTLVVLDNGMPVGLFGQEEALAAQNEPGRTPIERWMNPAVLCLPEHAPVHRAAEQCLELRADLIVAMRSDRPLGVVTGLDLVEALL